MSWVEIAIILGGAAVLGVVVPAVFVAMTAPKLAESELAARTNYRGKRVFMGLGIAWLVWAGGAIAGGVVLTYFFDAVEVFPAGLLMISGFLALVAFALGLVDDALGSARDRGFRGHFRALMRFRMTTGMLKLIGISLASVACAIVVREVAPWSSQVPGRYRFAIPAILLAGACVALTSNFMNLVDLRPGRALKLYMPFWLIGALLTGSLTTPVMVGYAPIGEFAPTDVVSRAGLAIFALGPVIAVWRYDLGERGMLGDAGANPMGAVAGLLIVTGLPLWGLVAY
ncbi:MAG: hypothetical protein HY876_02370, partial [Coriobacteriales bacterium]|nr:hypothetical protein [Coriobacteriales bacterium]